VVEIWREPGRGGRLRLVSATDPLRLTLEAARAGDDRAVAELVRATESHVRRLCAHLVGSTDAEDLAQDTYLRMLRAMHDFRGEAPVLVWLLAICRRACADHIRRSTRRAGIASRFPKRSRDVLADHSVELAMLLEDLPEDQRTAFELTQLLGFPYEEAAVLVGCPVGTIRSRVARARSRLLGQVRTAESA
jgi:RNA polymerase sigma-70 factor (ECF subfamily)